MLVVGLTGGIASGKTVVSKMLKDLGALIIDADEISREVVAPQTRCWEKLVSSFGKEILQEDLTLDRKKLADRVFNNPKELLTLNSLIHPEIMERIDDRLLAIKEKNPELIVIIDAALIIETGMYEKYDKLIVVCAGEKTQIERILHRDELSQDEAKKRIHSQLPLRDKIKIADFVIENEGALSKTKEQVEKVFNTISSLKSAQGSVIKKM